MRRFLPKSLTAQMLLLLGVALLAAQLVNFALILNERQKLSLAQNESPAINRFAEIAADLSKAAPEFKGAVLMDASQRGVWFELRIQSDVAEASRDSDIEARLTKALRTQGVEVAETRAGFYQREDAATRPATAPIPRWLLLDARLSDGRWLSGRLPVPPQDRWLALRLGAATLLVYAIVLGASIWAAIRLSRPLRDLTRAAEGFGGREAVPKVAPSGPADLRQAIEAFNAMNGRVAALLDEKDRMLGALGHDLRTPLASLRIRIEAMGPDDDRIAAVAKIDEMAGMLEEILVLARSGRAREPARRMDVAALVEALVVEQQELGRDVQMVPHARIVAEVQPGLLRRAVTNLIDNAVIYGRSARVSIIEVPDMVEIRIEDDGPGIPPDELADVLEPFYRRETSRNRATGGTGLGLPIAASIAESHGGKLTLKAVHADGTGLLAILHVPA